MTLFAPLFPLLSLRILAEPTTLLTHFDHTNIKSITLPQKSSISNAAGISYTMDSLLPSPPLSESSSHLSEYPENANPIHGPWVTVPPFTLPPGLNRCPVPECPSKIRFVPYWRLNEHMKTKHAWPRKQTQPHLDKRLGNHFASNHRKRRSSSALDDSIEGDEIEKRPRRSGANKDYSRLFENPYEAGIPVKKSLIVKLPVGAESLNSPTTSLHQSTTIPPSPPLSNIDDQPASKPEILLPDPIDPIDHFLTNLARSYLAELDEASFLSRSLPYPPSNSPQSLRQANPSTHTTHQHDLDNAAPPLTTLTSTLRSLLASKIQLATLITPERARALLPVYRALAVHADTPSFTPTYSTSTSPVFPTLASIVTTTPPRAKNQRLGSTLGTPMPGTTPTLTNTTFTFSGPRTQPWEFEQESPMKSRVKREEKRKSVASAFQTQTPLQTQPQQVPMQMEPPSPTQLRGQGPTQTPTQAASVKTGIKLRLKLTPARPVDEVAVATT